MNSRFLSKVIVIESTHACISLFLTSSFFFTYCHSFGVKNTFIVTETSRLSLLPVFVSCTCIVSRCVIVPFPFHLVSFSSFISLVFILPFLSLTVTPLLAHFSPLISSFHLPLPLHFCFVPFLVPSDLFCFCFKSLHFQSYRPFAAASSASAGRFPTPPQADYSAILKVLE